MKKRFYFYLLNIFVKLDNFCYKVLSFLAIKNNNGVHPKHKILNYHKFFVDNISDNDNIVDIGCGGGENAFDIAFKAKKVLAIDKERKNIEKAEKKYQRNNLKYLVGDAVVYDFKQKFDKIILSNVLEHIENRIYFLKKMHNLSNNILLRVPMLNRDWLTVYKKDLGLEYRLDSTHYIEYTLQILQKELAESGWKIESYSVQFGEFWGVVKAENN